MVLYVELTRKETTSEALLEFSDLIIYGTYALKAFSALTIHIRRPTVEHDSWGGVWP